VVPDDPIVKVGSPVLTAAKVCTAPESPLSDTMTPPGMVEPKAPK
jgi:hypothetical protein